jgi:hypothetical protein
MKKLAVILILLAMAVVFEVSPSLAQSPEWAKIKQFALQGKEKGSRFGERGVFVKAYMVGNATTFTCAYDKNESKISIMVLDFENDVDTTVKDGCLITYRENEKFFTSMDIDGSGLIAASLKKISFDRGVELGRELIKDLRAKGKGVKW